jgi:trans-aconitate methyltransferase
MPTVRQYRAPLSDVPFAESRVWGQNGDRHFGSLDEMVAWIDQPCLVPFLANIDEKDRKRFRDTVVNQMIERTRQTDGTFFETFRRLNVTARKQDETHIEVP